MSRNKKISASFFAAAVLLSDIMCAVVGFNYSSMLWGIKYECFSAPASAAFLTAIPYAAAIAVCVILAVYFRRKDAGRCK